MFLILGQKVKGQDHEVNISYIRQMCYSSYIVAAHLLANLAAISGQR